jgi:hypothetical protein
VEALCAALDAPRRRPRLNVDCARKRVLDYSTRTSAGMLIVFPKRATMIVTPGELDVTTPCGETPATPGLVEDHPTWSLSVAVTPLANRPVAVSALVAPGRRMLSRGRTVMSRSGLTCNPAAPILPLLDALTFVVPGAVAVTSPPGLTDATPADDEVHADEAVRSCVLLSE